jgi:hypothetical protein
MSGKRIIAGLKDALRHAKTGRGAKVRRFKPIAAEIGTRKWSEWITPIMRGYLMACCDCGLVHEIDFKALEVKKQRKRDWLYRELPRPTHRVAFRARRAEVHTRNQRKRLKP